MLARGEAAHLERVAALALQVEKRAAHPLARLGRALGQTPGQRPNALVVLVSRAAIVDGEAALRFVDLVEIAVHMVRAEEMEKVAERARAAGATSRARRHCT